ncbi:M1 family metallopeptidase [Actinomadura sp. NEAU-AAG7]|uniref:M1 family metallopeptidase n=1 Tax=Actinomadura sp. NEAU-AAG7 TaxID=2839640 RepID=UPI001BE43B9D|nr:M1 family metallopeptidase [Actinomadura sp. NEAU-AAG7]MBT2213229.1 M1 family metallopeptidase [Actinomadura sp. NEAU-AAG7]
MALRHPRFMTPRATPGRMLPLAVAAVSVVALAAPASAAGNGRYTPGAPGVGDAYFPLEGNGGYDVQHYSLDLRYDPDYDQLDGTVTITAKATQDLSSFDLDLSGLDVDRVKVNRQKADYKRRGQELIITPRKGLRKGKTFTAVVTYGGVPQTIVGSPIVFGSPYGFLHTPDGAFVGGEPNGASTWFPVNDHPSDKATYDYKIAVPKGLRVVANGLLTGTENTVASFSRRRSAAEASVFKWREDSPMASYLTTIDIGKWEIREGRTPGGLRNYTAVDPALLAAQPDALNFFYSTTSEATDLWAKTFGPYPFSTTGAIGDDARFNGQPLGFSLETQGKPVYSAVRNTGTIAHELAHQWFGDSVSPQRWQDVWLNESFASWSGWYWAEKHGGATVHDAARATYNSRPFPDAPGSPFWSVVTANPQRDTMFNARVYSGGAMALQFLRERIGDDKFFTLLRTWVAQHRHGNATTEQFTALAQKVSGQDLTQFFKEWIYSPTKPELPKG